MDFKNIRSGFSRASLTIAGIGVLLGILLIAIPVGFLLDLVFFIINPFFAFVKRFLKYIFPFLAFCF